MPTEADIKIAGDLANFRVEAERRFGQLGHQLAEVREELAGFRGATTTELGLIRKLGDRLLATAFGAIGTMIIGSATIAWAASAVVADVKHQGERIDRIEGTLDQMTKRMDRVQAGLESLERKLQILVDRGEPKSSAEPRNPAGRIP